VMTGLHHRFSDPVAETFAVESVGTTSALPSRRNHSRLT
jgi:hypothetical protein